jgi:molybdate transport system ATP-binding protein
VRPGQPIVTLERASVTLGGARVLREVSLRLCAGQGWALIGANGSGKSTLLRLLRGDQWLDPAGPGRRTYHVPEDPQASPIGARERMALCGPEDQDAYLRREVDLTVEAVIRSGLDGALYPVAGPTPARAARVRAAAAALGIEPLLARSILTLSRGEGRKALLARALAPGPDVLLLDEVCDGLDAASRVSLLASLTAVAAGGTTVVTAVHRSEELFDGVDQALMLERGRVVDQGAARRVVAGWRATLWHGTGGAAATGRGAAGRATTGRGTGDRAATGRGSTGRAATRPRATVRSRAGGTAGGRPPPGRIDTVVPADRPADDRPLFSLRSASVRVDGRTILDRVDWVVRAGEAWAVRGPNGAGKSTLLRLLCGEEQPASGTVERLDLGLRADASALRTRIGQVSPELQARHRFDASGEALVLSGFGGTIGLAEAPTRAQRLRARAVLAELGLSRLARRRILTCSYGELRLLVLARALAPAPEVLLLDEPFAGLDPDVRRSMGAAVERLVGLGTGLVLVTHHQDEIPAGVRLRARLEAGRLHLPSRPISSG